MKGEGAARQRILPPKPCRPRVTHSSLVFPITTANQIQSHASRFIHSQPDSILLRTPVMPITLSHPPPVSVLILSNALPKPPQNQPYQVQTVEGMMYILLTCYRSVRLRQETRRYVTSQLTNLCRLYPAGSPGEPPWTTIVNGAEVIFQEYVLLRTIIREQKSQLHYYARHHDPDLARAQNSTRLATLEAPGSEAVSPRLP